ncbi:MAG: Ca-activated chloride channel family protein, partial [Limisphaerales bacterium]
MMAFFDNIQFAHPWLFLLLGLIPLMIGWMILKYRKRYAAIRISALDGIANESPSWRVKLLPILFVFRLLAVAALITAIARPQSLFSEESI